VTNKQKFAHLETLAKQHGAHIEVVQAELQADQYVSAFQGARAVIHTATPYIYTAADPQKEIIDPAIEGTLSALRAAKISGVKRVVITSSGGAVFHFPVPAGYKFTAEDWNTQASLTNNPYFYSKKLAEEAAWKWSKENSEVEVVVVNPVFVQGPLPSANINTSVTTLKSYLLGTGKVAMPDGYARPKLIFEGFRTDF
jgi:nucleoside-diphosphate-sugar epimerase